MLEIILVQGFSLLKIKITQFVECKESQFYSLPFRQAEASILLAQTSFQLVPKTFWWADWRYHKSFLKKLHLPVGQVKNKIHWPNSKIH